MSRQILSFSTAKSDYGTVVDVYGGLRIGQRWVGRLHLTLHRRLAHHVNVIKSKKVIRQALIQQLRKPDNKLPFKVNYK